MLTKPRPDGFTTNQIKKIRCPEDEIIWNFEIIQNYIIANLLKALAWFHYMSLLERLYLGSLI
jgi:hypothetical protein